MIRRRLLAPLLVVVCAAFPTAASAGLIALKIEFRADAGSKPRVLTLRCAAKATGTVRSPALACARLQRLGRAAFRPTPPNMACTEIYGGPSTARVTGLVLGFPLWVRLSRTNGCEIARWQRVAFLLPWPASP
ncbi:MAG: subtilase-type protease inhibitor [Thermoleophilia bacterium]|nr:subtilase-type protease inhibitor [Thermoleophilia bacterium]